MLANRKIAVVIPAYRAESTLAGVINTLPAFVDIIVVVDDASPDKLSEVCGALPYEKLILERHARNRGVGGAMITGFKRALALKADIIVKMDADGQMDPDRLEELLEPLLHHGFDYAKANRFYNITRLKQMPLPRRLGNIALSFLTKFASGYWNVYDPQNGYLAITRQALSRLCLEGLDASYFFENSMLIQLNIISARVAEVPIPARYGNEKSSMHLARIVLAFPWKLYKGWLMRIRLKYFGMDFSPIALLLVCGSLLLLGGLGYGIYQWVIHAMAGVATPPGTVMLSALPVLLGIQFLLNALLLDIGQTPPGYGIRRVIGSEEPEE